MYSVYLYHNEDEFLRALKENDVSSNPYQKYSFYKVFLKYNKNNISYFYNIYDSQKQLVAIIPMECTFESTFFKVRILRFIGYRQYNYEQYICDDSKVEEVHQTFIDYLKNDVVSTVINYYDINNQSELYRILNNEKFCIGSNSLYGCPVVELDGNFDDFFKRLFSSSKKRAELKKFQNRLIDTGQIELINIYNSETYKKYGFLIKDIYRVHKERFARVYSTSFFSSDNMRNYYDELLRSTLNSGDAYLSMIVLDGVVIAFILCLANTTTLIDWIPAFDPAFAKYNLGTVQYKMLFEQLCEDKQYKYFDYSKGSSIYKRKWAKSETTNYQFTVRIKDNLSSLIFSNLMKIFFAFKSFLREKGILSKTKHLLGALKNIDKKNENQNSKISIQKMPYSESLQKCAYSELVKLPVVERKQVLDYMYNGYFVTHVDNKKNNTIIYISKK